MINLYSPIPSPVIPPPTPYDVPHRFHVDWPCLGLDFPTNSNVRVCGFSSLAVAHILPQFCFRPRPCAHHCRLSVIAGLYSSSRLENNGPKGTTQSHSQTGLPSSLGHWCLNYLLTIVFHMRFFVGLFLPIAQTLMCDSFLLPSGTARNDLCVRL